MHIIIFLNSDKEDEMNMLMGNEAEMFMKMGGICSFNLNGKK